MRLRWLGTAGVEFESGDTTILIDPDLTRNPQASPQQPLDPSDFMHVNAVFITHGHFDHTHDLPAVVAASGADVHASASVCEALIKRGMPAGKLKPMQEGESVEVGPFRVTAIPACHVKFDVPLVLSTLKRCLRILPRMIKMGPPKFPTGEVLGWLLEVDGKKLFDLGSGCMRWEPEEDIDIFLVPVQGRTDICEVAADLVRKVMPKKVIPHHFDDFYPPLSQTIGLKPLIDEVGRMDPDIEVSVPSINQWIKP
jgi:L-ascorbate metabolism protein UlaG (beta-lactamase superfamily)